MCSQYWSDEDFSDSGVAVETDSLQDKLIPVESDLVETAHIVASEHNLDESLGAYILRASLKEGYFERLKEKWQAVVDNGGQYEKRWVYADTKCKRGAWRPISEMALEELKEQRGRSMPEFV